MAAAAAAAEFVTGDRDDLDAGLAQQGVGVGVALVGDDHAGLQSDHVVAVVPLLALGLVGIAAGVHAAQLLEAERLGDDGREVLLLFDDRELTLLVARAAGRRATDGLHDVREQVDEIAVAEGEHRIQVHGGPLLAAWPAAITRSAPPLAKSCRAIWPTACGVVRSPMPISTTPLPIGIDIAALGMGHAVVSVLDIIAPPEVEVRVLEHRMELVDRRHVQGFLATGRPEHRMQRDPAVDPGRGVAGEELVRQRRQDEVLRLEQGAEHAGAGLNGSSARLMPPIRCTES